MIPPGYQAQMIGGLSAFNGALGHLLAQRLGNLTTPFKLDASILEANMCFTDLGAINAYNENPPATTHGYKNRFHQPILLAYGPARTAGSESLISHQDSGRPFASWWI